MNNSNVTCELYRIYCGAPQATLRFVLSGGMPFSNDLVLVDYRKRTLHSVHCDTIRFDPTNPRQSMYSPYLHQKAAEIPFRIRFWWMKRLGIHDRLMQVSFNNRTIEVTIDNMGHHTGSELKEGEKCIASILREYLGQDDLLVTVKEYDNEWSRFRPSH